MKIKFKFNECLIMIKKKPKQIIIIMIDKLLNLVKLNFQSQQSSNEQQPVIFLNKNKKS